MSAPLEVRFMILDDRAVAPSYAHPGDAGLDLVAIEEASIIQPGWSKLCRTGIAVAVPYGYCGLVIPRSGLANKSSVTILNAPGLIDSGYRGEIHVLLVNHHKTLPYHVSPGDRIAQLVIQPYPAVQLVEVTEFEDTARGTNGYGSTGR